MRKLLLLLSFVPFLNYGQTYSISGVVTYFFNNYQGDKADIGARVYLVKNTKEYTENLKTVDSFELIKTYYNLYSLSFNIYVSYQSTANDWKKIPFSGKAKKESQAKADLKLTEANNYLKEAIKFGYDSTTFKNFDNRVSDIIRNIKYSKGVIETTVNGIGSYSISANQDDYLLLIISAGRTGRYASELLGKYNLSKIQLKDNNIDRSVKFDL